MNYVIESYKGVNEFTFGLTQEQVTELAGPADEVKPNHIRKNVIEMRGACRLEYRDQGKLKAVSILKSGTPIFNDIAVFEKGGFEKLCELEQPVGGIGQAYLLFKKLGLCLGGYAKKRIPEGKVLIVFAEDRLEYYENFIDV